MNNKFKRFNKILMMTVALLLCLVLISTSVVSGIFAKYVITKSAGATVSLKAFGLTLAVAGKTGYVASTTTVNSTTVDTAVTVPLAPGDDINDVLTVTIGGEATVNTNLVITVKGVKLTSFSVKNVGGVGSTAVTYIPIGFTAIVNSSSEATLQSDWSSLNATNLQNNIASGLKTALDSSVSANAGSVSSNVVTKQICALASGATTATPTVTSIKFGFYSPTSPTSAITSGHDADVIQTHLGNQGANLTIIYSISLQQKVS